MIGVKAVRDFARPFGNQPKDRTGEGRGLQQSFLGWDGRVWGATVLACALHTVTSPWTGV